MYWMVGNVKIPQNKKDEFNRNILKLLNICGIRKTEQIKLVGQCVTVVCMPQPDENGIVSFDYSIFERMKRSVSQYDMNTCQLHTDDRGFGEFGLAMNLIMTMQEAYSQEYCYMMYRDELYDVTPCAILLESVLGLRLKFENRARIWDMLLFFKSDEKYGSISFQNIFDKFPFRYATMDMNQLFACLCSESDNITKPENTFVGDKTEIVQASSRQRRYYAFELFEKLRKEKKEEEISALLKELLNATSKDRKKRAMHNDIFAIIAEISLHEHEAVVVAAYAKAIKKDFWELWFELGIESSRNAEHYEEVSENNNIRKRLKKNVLHKVFFRENEDEFIEFWQEEKLELSHLMIKNMERWKMEYELIVQEDIAEISVEEELAQILVSLGRIAGCRYMDGEVVAEFLENVDDARYKKAIVLFRRILMQNSSDFPELTETQVRTWLLPNDCCRENRVSIAAYQSLLGNHMHRFEIFGF